MTPQTGNPAPGLDYEDIQGIVLRGYGKLHASCFIMLRITDGKMREARSWLGRLADRITVATPAEDRKQAIQLAFTLEGLRKLGLDAETRFSCEFEDGISARHKSRILGDTGDSDPSSWAWGGDSTEPIHLMLMLYSVADRDDDTSQLDRLYAVHKQDFQAAGLVEVMNLTSRTLTRRKEHFGFTDGISQPVLEGTRRSRTSNKGNVLAAGEFILGYRNAYGKHPASPSIRASFDRDNRLPILSDGRCDLGRNGSYLVFRQLSQDVRAFWEFLNTKANGDPGDRDRLAAKMLGRWRSGASLMQYPDGDRPGVRPDNDFNYVGSVAEQGDPFGFRCPLGSHVRRTNPRDSVFPGTNHLITDANTHRILRRSRAYGPPVAHSMDPGDILAAPEEGPERGLHFICLNADIGRQFEFIQHTWINNPKFANLYGEVDPLLGDHGDGRGSTPNEAGFTIPGQPIRQRIAGMARFVHVRGAAYFFLPGIAAIRVLAQLGD